VTAAFERLLDCRRGNEHDLANAVTEALRPALTALIVHTNNGTLHTVMRWSDCAEIITAQKGLTCRRQSLLPRYCDEGIQGGIVRLDSFKARFRQFDRGDGLAPKKVGRFLQREVRQVLRRCKAWLQEQASGPSHAGR